jgi:2-succinyl-6-hydroxy-2,4-cyclohexadiene-1-carboxylate synthase
MILIGLHGFFGIPSDWKKIGEILKLDVVTPDLSIWATRAEVTDFQTFAKSMNRSVQILSEERNEPIMIVGYSMGARLAAACVLAAPELYKAALFVSMNPGLADDDSAARDARAKFDKLWAARMRLDPWEETWRKWNNQDVLKPGSRTVLKSADVTRLSEISRTLEGRREAWARAMEIWSLAKQPDNRKSLIEWAQAGRPTTVMTGTEDVKFTELTTAWVKDSADSIRHRLSLSTGHRVLTEAPEDVASEISTLLRGL